MGDKTFCPSASSPYPPQNWLIPPQGGYGIRQRMQTPPKQGFELVLSNEKLVNPGQNGSFGGGGKEGEGTSRGCFFIIPRRLSAGGSREGVPARARAEQEGLPQIPGQLGIGTSNPASIAQGGSLVPWSLPPRGGGGRGTCPLDSGTSSALPNPRRRLSRRRSSLLRRD